MTPGDKDIDLEPSEWSSVDKPPPFWGPRWWVVPAFFILVAVLTYFEGKGGPWALIIARSL
jgi:hypothetical protein